MLVFNNTSGNRSGQGTWVDPSDGGARTSVMRSGRSLASVGGPGVACRRGEWSHHAGPGTTIGGVDPCPLATAVSTGIVKNKHLLRRSPMDAARNSHHSTRSDHRSWTSTYTSARAGTVRSSTACCCRPVLGHPTAGPGRAARLPRVGATGADGRDQPPGRRHGLLMGKRLSAPQSTPRRRIRQQPSGNFVCPLHGFAYNLDGNVTNVPLRPSFTPRTEVS